MTREALAAAVGIPQSHLIEIETYRHPGSFDDIARLASVLRVSLDDIATWLAKDGPQ